MVIASVSEVRANLQEMLQKVEDGDEIVLTRHGRQIAVIVRPDVLRARRAGPALDAARSLRERLERARDAPLPQTWLTPERADELVDAVRRARDRKDAK